MKQFKSVSTLKCIECEGNALEFCYMETAEGDDDILSIICECGYTTELVRMKNNSITEIANLKSSNHPPLREDE